MRNADEPQRERSPVAGSNSAGKGWVKMKRATGAVTAVALLATGVLADRTFNSSGDQSALAQVGSTTAAGRIKTTTVANSAVSAYDSLAETAFAIASPSVVYVENVGVGSGSGVIYDSSGDIVTNAHVVAGGSTFRVTFNTGKTLTATLLGSDTADDLAVLHVHASGLQAAHFAGAGTLHVAQTVLAIGNPLGLQQSVTSGLISALKRTVQETGGGYLPH